MPSDRELDAVAEAIDEARAAARAERESRPFGGTIEHELQPDEEDYST